MSIKDNIPVNPKTFSVEPIKEIEVLWLTAGLGCDGDTIAMTAATQPSIEEVVMGGIPGIPRVHFHNPFPAFENGDEFVDFFHQGANGNLDPFIFIVEGSIPNEKNKAEGYWASFGTSTLRPTWLFGQTVHEGCDRGGYYEQAQFGDICIGCTMPGFPDKFIPFMNKPPGSLLSSHAVMTYGKAIHDFATYRSVGGETRDREQFTTHLDSLD